MIQAGVVSDVGWRCPGAHMLNDYIPTVRYELARISSLF